MASILSNSLFLVGNSTIEIIVSQVGVKSRLKTMYEIGESSDPKPEDFISYILTDSAGKKVKEGNMSTEMDLNIPLGGKLLIICGIPSKMKVVVGWEWFD